MASAETVTYSQAASRAANAAKKAVAMLLHGHEHASDKFDERWLVGYEAEKLLETFLWEGESLVSILNEESELKHLRELAEALGTALRKRDIVMKLANTEGRTVEERKAFEAKAAELS